jgi:hypothetical protein
VILLGLYSGSANLKQSESVEVHTGSIPTGTHSTSTAKTKGGSFLTNQTRVTGVQDVITRMKNADQGQIIFIIYGILIFVLIVVIINEFVS